MPDEDEEILFLNPRILNQPKKLDGKYEGCWSFFDVRGLVLRPMDSEIAYQTPEGKNIRAQFTRGAARLIAHEIDHLQGILYTSVKAGREADYV